MRCSRCGAEMKIKNVKVDIDIYGNPIYNKYAYCYNCRIKRNLGQQKGSAGRNTKRLSHNRAKQRRQKQLLLTIILVLLLAIIAVLGIFFAKQKKSGDAKTQNAIVTNSHNNEISTKAFYKLETGMTLNEIEDLIGNGGSKLMQVVSDDSKTERYQWIAKDGDGAVILTFEDEKLISFSQADMILPDSTTLSADVIQKIKFEMSYKDVTETLGADGTLLSETLTDGITTSIYAWYDKSSDTRITIVFQDDKVLSIK